MNVFTVPMRLLTAVVIDEAADKVKSRLLDLGVLDFIKVSNLAPDQKEKLTEEAVEEKLALYGNLRARIETLFQQANLNHPPIEKIDPNDVQALNTTKIKSRIDEISDELGEIRDKQKQLSQLRIRVEEMYNYLVDNKLQYLDVRIGKPESVTLDVLEGRLVNLAHTIVENKKWDQLILLTLRRDRQQITPIMETLKWVESSDGSLNKRALEILEEHLKESLIDLDQQNRLIKEQIKQRIAKDQNELEEFWSQLKLHELLNQISGNFSRTRNTTIFSGWVPASKSESLEKAIREASDNSCVIEWTEAESLPREQVPVAVDDIPLLRPFQKLVDNYSVPEYGTINPTPFVAVSYLAMFGLMFADAGQGLIILLLGILGTKFYKPHPSGKPSIISGDMYNLFIYLGSASIVSGALFGSYFGFPLFKPLWFNYHEVVALGEYGGRTVYSILKITIWFGIVVIGTGLILNWINLIRKKSYVKLLMDKNGLIGGWIFGLGVWTAFAFVATGYKSIPSSPFVLYGFAIPLIALLFKIPLQNYDLKKSGTELEKQGIGSLIMDIVLEWIVDILEIFSGFLANTLSFMRVAGLGIAHVSLMTAFSEMANMTSGVAAILILVVGNALVIALEGLSAGIQALRLNYYEFFTKYFTGRGLSYNPIALRPHAGKSN